MRLSTKSRFAVSAMLDVALHQQHGSVPLSTISKRIGASVSYLEQIFGRLRQCGVVSSVRGPGGGYCLARPAANVAIADIVMAIDGPQCTMEIGDHRCTPSAEQGVDTSSVTHFLWNGLNRKILDYLTSVSLQDLVETALASRVDCRSHVQLRQRYG